MSTSKICLPCIFLRFFACLLWLGAIAVGSLLDADRQTLEALSGFDKLFHFLGYGIATWLTYRFFASLVENVWWRFAGSFGGVFLFGAALEILQQKLTQTRRLDPWDLVANLGGILLVLVVCASRQRFSTAPPSS